MADGRVEDLVVTRTIELDVDAERLWAALTETDELAAWLGTADLDLRPGGQGTVVDDDGVVRYVEVGAVEPARRLSWRWWPEGDEDTSSAVELAIVPTESGTRLVVTEKVAPTEQGVQASAASSRRAAVWAWRLGLLALHLSLLVAV